MSKKKSNQSREEFKEEEIVQAVVIADSFNVRFAPLTKDRPRVRPWLAVYQMFVTV